LSNPLLNKEHLPSFSDIKPEHVIPALDTTLEKASADIKILESHAKTATWNNFASKLQAIEMQIDDLWSTVSHLNSVMDSQELREAYQAGKEKLTAFHTALSQNLLIFEGYKTILASTSFSTLNQAQQKIINNTVRDFKLSGAELPDEKQKRFAEIVQKSSKLQTQFEQNLLDATQSWHLLVDDESELSGMPDYAIELAKTTAHRHEQQGYRFGLDIPSYLAIMKFADSARIRETVYFAYATRASKNSPDKTVFDNEPIIDEILALRHEKAELLGYQNYAEFALVTKMANSVDQICNFLNDIATHAKPKAKKELAELTEFVKTTFDIDKLNPWDYSYYSEKLKQHQYALDNEKIKPYFPAETVFNGMFEIAHRLFGINLSPSSSINAWHEDVLSFDVKDSTGNTTGQLFADLYARPNKRGGAWMGACRHRQKNNDTTSVPVAYLTCNFTPASSGKPALLTHDEVETLFHEFGHTLHHLLTQVNEMSVAGINGVAWDAVELPSQFFENWCWHPESLPLISSHYKTGEALPKELLEKMLAAKHFQTGMQTVRQLEFSLFDILLHSQQNKQKESRKITHHPDKNNVIKSVQKVLDEARSQVSVIETPDYNRFQCSFSHIFAGGYSAGYYSYKWAEVLSADAFGKFEEDGVFNRETGSAFKETILARGGVPDASDMFENFRGRQPEVSALLKSTGLI
jgi:oligopeptidase A